MTAENNLDKTITADRKIRDTAACIGTLSTAAVCLNPLVLFPSAVISGAVFFIAEHRLKVNQKKSGSKGQALRG